MRRNVKIATAIFGFFALSVTIVYAALTVITTIPTSGIMATPQMSATPSSINWGTIIKPGWSYKTVKLENTGNVSIANLQITYTLPAGFTGDLTWNLTGQNLAVDEIKTAAFNLTITDGPLQPFAFDINICGET